MKKLIKIGFYSKAFLQEGMVFVFLLIGINLQAQVIVNTDANFYKYVELKNAKDCNKLDDSVYTRIVSQDNMIDHLATLSAYGNCLLASGKAEESQKALNLSIKTAIENRLYFIGRDGLELLKPLISFYKPDELLKHAQRTITYDSLYSSTEQVLVSRKALIFTYHYLNKPQKSLEQAEIVISASKDTSLLCDAFFGKALALTKIDPAAAESIFLDLMTLSVRVDSFARSSYFKKYGDFLLSQGRRIESADYLLKAIEHTPQSTKYDLSRTGSLNNLSQLFYGLKQYDRARQYIDQSIEICERNSYKSRNAVTAMVNAQILYKEGNIEEAMQEIANSKKYFKERNDLKGVISNLSLEGEIAASHFEDKQYALKCNAVMDSILAINNSFNVPLQVYGAKALIANKYGAVNEKELAFNTYLEASKIENDPVGKLYSLKGLYQLARAKGDYLSSLEYLEKHNEIADQLFETEQVLTVNQLESEYNRKGQDLQIASLDKENKLKAQTVSLQRKAIAGSGVALGMFALLSFFLYRLYKKVNSQKAIIEKALGEKDILLREIHHRVKNNLQLVSSLLTIQSRDIQDEQALEALSVGKSRVKSMSLIHQDLYQKEKLTGINVKNYLEKLSSELFNTYKISEDQIDLHLEIENIDLDVDTIVPLGLIINELITNALKYAFPQGRSGNIFIEFKMVGDAMKLMVKDDGVGMVDSISTGTSYGNTLIRALTKQLDGKITLKGELGTEVVLLFNDYKIAA